MSKAAPPPEPPSASDGPRPAAVTDRASGTDRVRLRAEAESLLRQAHRQTDAAARARRCLEAGDLYLHGLNEAVTASRAWLAAVEAHPAEAEAALARLEALTRTSDIVEITANYVDALGRAGRWVAVAAVLAGQAEYAEAPAERVGLLLAAVRALAALPGGGSAEAFAARRRHLLAAAQVVTEASLAGGEAGRDAEAGGLAEAAAEVEAELESALALHPSDAALAVASARFLTAARRPERALAALSAATAALPPGPARAALSLDAALLAADGAAAPRAAVAWFAAALGDDAELADAVEARLAALAGRWAHDAGVVAAAVAVFDDRGEHWRAHQVLAHAAERAPIAEAPARRLALARHAEAALGDVEAAFALFLDGLNRAEGDLGPFAEGVRRTASLGVPGGVDRARAAFETLGLWRPLAHLFEDAAGLARSDVERAAAFFQAGEVHENQLDDLDEALRCYVEAHNHDRREAVYLSAGERIYRRRGDWRMVDRLLALQVKSARDAAVRRRLLEEQARVRHRHLGDPLQAYEALRAALAQGGPEGGAPGTRRALEALVEDDAAFAAIESGLRVRAEREGGAVRARLYLEIAALQTDVRHRPADGTGALMAAADAVPEDEDLLAEVVSRLSASPSLPRVARWLVAAGQRAVGAEVQAAALAAGARMFATLDRPADTAAAWRALLDRAPTDLAVFEAARHAASEAGPAALLALLRDAVGGVVGPARVPNAIQRTWMRDLVGAADAVGDAEAALEGLHWLVADDPLDEPRFEDLLARLAARGDGVGRLAAWDLRFAAWAEAGRAAPPAARWAAARVAEEETGQPRRAAALLRPLYADNPADPAVRDALDRLLALAEDRAGRLALWSEALDLAVGLRERQAAAERLERLAAEAPVDREALVRARAERAADDDPARLDAYLEALRGLPESPASLSALAEALGRRYATDPGAHQAALLVEQAGLRAAAGDLEAAIFTWKTVRALLPEWDAPLAALQGLHAQRQDAEALFEVLWARHNLAADEDVAVALLREAASVAEVRLAAPGPAVAVWQRIGELRPEDLEVEAELVRLAELAEDWPLMLHHGCARLGRLQGHRWLNLARRLARVAEGAGDAPEIAAALWAQVLAVLPADLEALEARLATARRGGDAAALAEALDAVAAETEAVDRRAALVQERAALLEALGQTEAAEAAWTAVASWLPRARAPWDARVRLAEVRGDGPALVRALVETLRRVSAPAEVQALSLRLAAAAEAVGDAALAQEAWERVLAFADSGSAEEAQALGALRRLYLARRQVDELLKVVQLQHARAPDDAARVALHTEVAAALEALGPAHAAAAFKARAEAWRLAPAAAAEALLGSARALASRSGLWAAWAELLGQARARATAAPAAVALLLERSAVEETRLSAPDRALASAVAAFQLAPEDPACFERVEALAHLLGDHSALADVARSAAEHAPPARRSGLWMTAAKAAETHLGDPDRAFEDYARAAEAGHPEAEDALAALATRFERWPALVAWFERRAAAEATEAGLRLVAGSGTGSGAEAAAEPPRPSAHRRLAHLLETRAGQLEPAFEQYLLALQAAPRDAEARAAVWRLAGRLNAWPLVGRALWLQAQRAEAAERRVDLLHLLAEVQDRHLGDPQTALETLRAAFSVRPGDARTRAAMRAVAAQAGREAIIGRFFEEEAGWAEARETRLALYREAAAAFESAGDPAEAARVLGRTLELLPGDETVVEDLLNLRRGAHDPLALAAALARFVREGAPRLRADRLAELALLYAGPLEAPAKAEETWRRRLELVPEDAECFERLAASLAARQQWRALEETLSWRAEQAARPEHADWADAPVRLDLVRRRAEVLHGPLGKPREAFALLVEVARAQPEDVALLRRLAEWAPAADGHARLLDCAEHTAALVTGPALAEVLVLVGRLARDRFGNDKKARQAFGRALALAPEDAALGRELAALLRARNLHRDLAALHQQVGPALVAAAGESPTEAAVQARWALALADLQADQLFRPAEAQVTLAALVAAQPAHREAWRRLRTVAERTRDGATLLQAAERLAALEPEAAAGHWQEAAGALERLGEREPARAAWRARLQALPDDAAAREALARHAARDGGYAALAADLAAVADRCADPAGAWVDLGRLHRAEGGDVAAADAAFAAALARDPDRVEALAGRVALAQARGDVERLDALTEGLAARLAAGAVAPGAADALAALAAALLFDRAQRATLEAPEPPWAALASGPPRAAAAPAQASAVPAPVSAPPESAAPVSAPSAPAAEGAPDDSGWGDDSVQVGEDEASADRRRAPDDLDASDLDASDLDASDLDASDLDVDLADDLDVVLADDLEVDGADDSVRIEDADIIDDSVVIASQDAPPPAPAPLDPAAARLHWLATAHRLAPERVDVAERYADALVDAGQLTAAATLYLGLPAPRGTGPEDAAGRARSALRRGRALAAAGHAEAALRAYEWAAQQPEARALALRAQAALQRVAGRTEAAVRLYAKLAEASVTAEGRVEALVTAAELADRDLRKPARAAALFGEAVAAGADALGVLRRWFALLLELHRGAEAEAVGLRILAHPELGGGAERAAVWTALGQRAAAAVREGLDEGATAVARFAQALEADGRHAPAAEGLLTLARSLAPPLRARALETVTQVAAALAEVAEGDGPGNGGSGGAERARDPETTGAPGPLVGAHAQPASRGRRRPEQRDASPEGLRDRLLFGLGQVHAATGAPEAARAAFQTLLARRPDHAAAHEALAAGWRHAAAEIEARQQAAAGLDAPAGSAERPGGATQAAGVAEPGASVGPETPRAAPAPEGPDPARAARRAAARHQRHVVRLRPGDAAALRLLATDRVALGAHRQAALPRRLAALLAGETLPPVQRPPLDDLDAAARRGLLGADPFGLPAGRIFQALDQWIGPALDARLAPLDPTSAAEGVAVDGPLAAEVARLAEALGVPAPAALRAALDPGPSRVALAALASPALAIGAEVGRLPEGLRRFLLGRALEGTRGPARWLTGVPEATVAALFGAALRFASAETSAVGPAPSRDPAGSAPEAASAAERDWHTWLHATLGKRQRRTLASLAAPALLDGAAALATLRAAVRDRCLSAGLVLSGDLLAALDQVAEEAGEPVPLRLDQPETWPALLARVPAAAALYTLAFGDALAALDDG